jgi:selenide,water dikinase
LAQVLRRLTPTQHPNLVVGNESGDDAAVWRVDERRGLVFTADFITPIVDDARAWGRIAAANAASDVWAMGGRPLLALNLVAWNTDELSEDLLVEVLQGSADAAAEGGWVVVGGHTVDDPLPKFGQAVVGDVDLDRVLTNTGLRAGDTLVLTKALGTGVISTAIKRGEAGQESMDAAVASMTRLNAAAADAALQAGATGATDVTGFGLLGHLARMAEASAVDVEVDAGAVPLLPGVGALAAEGVFPGGTHRNLAWVRPRLRPTGGADEDTLLLLADAQTSGGLLFGAPPDAARQAVEVLRASGHDASVIGRTTGRAGGQITVSGRATDQG